MAVGNIPTLMDINWQQVNQAQGQKRQSDFILDYTKSLRNRAISITPRLGYGGGKLSYASSGAKRLTDTDLWNDYVQNSQSRNIKPNVDTFESQILPYYKNLSMQSFNQQLGAMTAQGVSTKKYHDLYKANPDFRKTLMQAYQGTDPSNEMQLSLLRTLIPQDEGEGIWGAIKKKPLEVGVGGAIGVGAARAAYAKAKTLGATGKFPSLAKNLKMYGPAALAIGAEPLSKMFGATEKEAKYIGTGTGAAVGGYYGTKAFQNLSKNRLMRGLASDKYTQKQLVSTAKKLGIKNVKSNVTKQAARELVENKIKGQSVKATTKAVGKTTIKKALAKFGAKAGAKQLAGSALPVWGNIAMAALSIPDLVELAKALWSGGEGEATPTNEIAVPPK